MKNHVAAAAIVIAGFVFGTSTSSLAGKNVLNIDFDQCARTAITHLEKFGISESDITDYNYVEVAEGGRAGMRLVNLEYWIRVKQCESGAVVVDMTQTCQVRQSFTRRSCAIEGLRRFR